MKRRSFLALAALATLVGCGPHWRVMAQAAPDPFLNQNHFAVLPIDFTGLRVGEKSEGEYLSEKDQGQREDFAKDKAGVNGEFIRSLVEKAQEQGISVVPATGPDSAPFLIRPSVQFIEPGFYVGVASHPSRVSMVVHITAPDGRIFDEVVFIHQTAGSLTTPSTTQRLRDDGEAIGKYLAEYLKERVGGPKN